MSVKYILAQVGAKIGLNPNAQASRNVLLRFLNEAAPELYAQADVPGSLMEQTMKMNGDQTISLPYYVGYLRAIREAASQVTWSINQLRPRYNQFNWQDMWRNFRLKNIQALQSTVTNQSVGVLTVHEVENPPVVITVTGPTENSSSISESVTMDAVSKQTTNQFTDYTSVKKDRVNNFNIFLHDVDGKLLTTIPNNMLEARYQIVDISSAPWLQISSGTTTHYVEILFKKILPWLYQDEDEFPAPGYDNVLVNKMIQLWMEEQGKTELAIAYDTKATRTLSRIIEEQNRATEDVIALTANPHDVILPRVRHGKRRYWRGFGTRGYSY